MDQKAIQNNVNITSKVRRAVGSAALGAFILCSAAWSALADNTAASAGTNSPAGPSEKAKAAVETLPKAEVVELILGDGAGLTALYKNERIGIVELNRRGGGFTRDKVRFATSGDGNFLSLRAQGGEVYFACKDFKGVSGVIKPGNELVFSVRKETGTIVISSAPNNRDPLDVILPDGGKVEMSVGSTIRIEPLANGCYSVLTTRRVVAVNWDGQRMLLTENSLPMHGGPIYEYKDRLGVARMERVNAVVAFRILGMDKQTLRLRAGSEEISLPATVARTLTLTKGVVMQVSQDPQTGTFNWRVVKGEISMTIEGILGWKAAAVSGCGGSMVWDTRSMTVDFRNTSGELLRISLPARTLALVEPGSTFQYSVAHGGMRYGPTTAKDAKGPSYTTAATGRARIYNSLNHHVYDVVAKNQLFIGGVPSKEQDEISVSRVNIQTTWDNGLPFAFKMGTVTNGIMQPGEHKDVKYDAFHEVEFIYGQGGMLTVVAVEGGFHLIVQNANGMRLNVEEGNKVILTLDLKKKTFVLETGPENVSMIDLETDGGSDMAVEPDRFINFNLSDDGSIVGQSSDNGGLILFNSPGANPGSPGNGYPGTPGGGGNGTTPGSDPSLLSQPLVTP